MPAAGPGGKALLALVAFAGLTVAWPSQAYAGSKKFGSYIRTIYNNTNGLPGGESNDIASTGDGLLWIGTYAGLYRHNGKEFRLMNEYDSIKTVRCLYVDADGRLLVGTNDNGLSILINDDVVNIISEKNGLPSDSVRCITSASDGMYYADGVRTSEILKKKFER